MFTKGLNTLGVLLLLGLAACGAAEVDSSDVSNGKSDPSTRSLESNVIVGPLNWKSVTELAASSPERARSRAVGFLQYTQHTDKGSKPSRCTAWLVSKDVVITNGHCISNKDEAIGALVSFNYEEGVGSHTWYDCSTFIRSWGNGHDNNDEDITALRCTSLIKGGPSPGDVYGHLNVSATDVAQNTPIYVIHQNCDYETDKDCSPTKKYSPGKVLNPAYNSDWVSHDADTLKGSSGGPMLSQSTHEVVGLNRGHAKVVGTNQGDDDSVNTAVRGSIVRACLKEIGL